METVQLVKDIEHGVEVESFFDDLISRLKENAEEPFENDFTPLFACSRELFATKPKRRRLALEEC